MILVDAGPLVALLDADHRDHGACVAALSTLSGPLATVWPVVAEALASFRGLPEGQQAVLGMLGLRRLRLLSLDEEDLPRIRELMAVRRSGRIGVAEAALVRVAEREGLDTVFTLEPGRLRRLRIAGRRGFRIVCGRRGKARLPRRPTMGK